MSIGAIDFLRPAALVLFAVLLLLWWWHLRSIAPLRGWRKIAAIVARMLAVSLTVLALADPRWNGISRDEEVIFVVDQSASLGLAARDAALDFYESADLGGAESAWLAFGGVGRVFGDSEAMMELAPEAIEPDATRIDTALALATASFRPGRVRTIVLFSDGVSTGGEVSGKDLADSSVRVHVVPVNRPDTAEVLVRSVEVPASVREGEPVGILAQIQSTRDVAADVDLFRNGVRLGTRKVSLKRGTNEVQFDDRAGTEKLLHYEVAVRAGEDTIAENNLAGAAALASGNSRVLLLTDRPESARYLELALRQEGVELAVRPAEGVPTQMSDLQNFDTVIIDNIPASEMTRAQMDLIQTYVADFGGGLLMLGGDQAYGLGGYFRTPIEDVLPVQCDFQKDEETPSLGLALVIDRSGSMSGDSMELAKAAASASVDLLGARDEVTVIAFDSESHLVSPLQSASNSASVAADIASITAGGGTSIAPAMEEALRQLTGSSAKLKHVILLTDGHSEPGPFFELTTAMTQNQITVSTVAVGGADTELLSQIAQWGNGRYYETADASTVPQIFTKETMTASKSAVQEFPFLARPVRAVDFLEGVPWAESPFLLGYVRAKAKPTSETWLVTERGDPLLTTWRFGLGTTAAFTSDARNRWAVEWLRWDGFGKFWSQLLRRLGRPASLGLSEIEISEGDDSMRIRVDALDANLGFPSGVTGSIRIASPDGETRTIALEKSHPGRWEAVVQGAEPGITSGQVVLERDGEPFDSRFFTVTRSFPAEYMLKPTDEKFLATLAEDSGGDVNPDPATVFLDRERTARSEYELWPWLALLALLIFVVDVGLRRWPDNSPLNP